MNTNEIFRCAALGALLLLGLLALPARAQTSFSTDTPQTWAALIAQEGEWTRTLTGDLTPDGLADVDLNAFTSRDWKHLRGQLLATLRSGRGDAWEDAAQQVTYLSFYYRDQIDLGRASEPLLESYILDRNEQHRIMALAALHAIGGHDAMAYLVQRVRLERSARIRRLTVAALADHYGVRDYYSRVEVGMPEVVRDQQPAEGRDR